MFAAVSFNSKTIIGELAFREKAVFGIINAHGSHDDAASAADHVALGGQHARLPRMEKHGRGVLRYAADGLPRIECAGGIPSGHIHHGEEQAAMYDPVRIKMVFSGAARDRAVAAAPLRDLQTAEVVERAVLGEKRRGGFCLFFHSWLLEIV